MQQLITGLASFRRGLREPRPVHCNLRRLADSGVPILVLISDETLHDGHFIFIDQQQVVADELRSFLAGKAR
jgi:hypothetical protein